MKVCEHVANLLELDQQAEVWFIRSNEDQLIYMVSFLPNNNVNTKVCLQLPTAIDKREIKSQEKQ